MSRPPTASRTDPLSAVGLVVLLTATAYWSKAVLVPVVLAILLAFVLTPAVQTLQRWGLRRKGAVLLTIFGALVLAGGTFYVVGSQLLELARDLPGKKDNITRKLHDLQGGGPSLADRWVVLFNEVSRSFHPEQAPPPGVQPVLVVQADSTGLSAGQLLPWVAEPAFHTLSSTALILGLAALIMLLREDLRNRLIRLAGSGHLTHTTRALEEATTRIGLYLSRHTVFNLAVGLVFGLGLALMGVEYAWLWGFLVAVCRFVPYLGYWLAAPLPVLISIAAEGWVQPILVALWVALTYVIADQVLNSRVVMRSTGVSVIALVVAATFWAWLWGPIGLLLSTPITVCLQVLGKYVPSLAFLDVLFGTAPPLDPRQTFYQRLVARDEGEAADLLEEFLTNHTPAEACDELLIPALRQARADQEAGRLGAEEVAAMVAMAGDLVEFVPFPEAKPAPSAPVLLACAAQDPGAELACRLLARLVPAEAGRVEVVPPNALTAEVVQRAAEERAAAVAVLTLPPGGQAQARHLCKRLRAQLPALPVLVGCLGAPAEAAEGLARPLMAAGATDTTPRLQDLVTAARAHLRRTALAEPKGVTPHGDADGAAGRGQRAEPQAVL